MFFSKGTAVASNQITPIPEALEMGKWASHIIAIANLNSQLPPWDSLAFFVNWRNQTHLYDLSLSLTWLKCNLKHSVHSRKSTESHKWTPKILIVIKFLLLSMCSPFTTPFTRWLEKKQIACLAFLRFAILVEIKPLPQPLLRPSPRLDSDWLYLNLPELIPVVRWWEVNGFSNSRSTPPCSYPSSLGLSSQPVNIKQGNFSVKPDGMCISTS